MLLVLKDHLTLVGERLSRPLFTKFWQRLASRLNTFLLNEVSDAFVAWLVAGCIVHAQLDLCYIGWPGF